MTAAFIDIHKTHVRNCDTPVIKREITLPCSPSSQGKAECARDRAMSQPLRSRRSYDHRIREIVCRTGNPRIFHHLRIPRSTTTSWLSRGRPNVVSLDRNHGDMASVLDENERLKRRVERQTAIIRLLVVLLKLSGFRLDEQRLPDGAGKGQSPACGRPLQRRPFPEVHATPGAPVPGPLPRLEAS